MTPEQEKLVTDNLRLVTYCCRPYAGQCCYEDLKGEANLALVNAALTYDFKEGTFSNWAVNRIKWKIASFLRKQDGLTVRQKRCYAETGLIYRPGKPKKVKEIKINSVLDPFSFKKGFLYNERIHLRE